jgi:hypothetical protein
VSLLLREQPHVTHRRWPYVGALAARVRNAVELDLTSLYLADEASGNLLDRIGAHDLVAAGTPVYRDVVGGKLGTTYNSSSDGHSADVHDFAEASGLFVLVAHFTTTPDTFVCGRVNPLGTAGAFLNVATPASGTLRASIRDSGAGALTLAPATDVRGKTMIAIVQVDRAAATARLFLKARGEASITATGSIAGFSTLSEASQSFALCNPTGVTSQTGGFTALMVAVATGEQTEGETILERIAGRLHF